MNRRRSSWSAALLLFGAVGCTNTPTTGLGPLAQVDLKPQLPTGVTAPPEAEQKAHEGTKVICTGDASHPGAEIKVRWKSFEKGDSAYITGLSFEVTRTAEGLKITPPKTAMIGSLNLTPDKPFRGFADAWFECRREMFGFTQNETDGLQVDVDGKIRELQAKAKK
jgi:hypothetical protein